MLLINLSTFGPRIILLAPVYERTSVPLSFTGQFLTFMLRVTFVVLYKKKHVDLDTTWIHRARQCMTKYKYMVKSSTKA